MVVSYLRAAGHQVVEAADGASALQSMHAQMRAEVDRMVDMVDDLFALSKIHAGVLSLTLQTVAVGDLVSETIAGAEPVARARDVRLGGTVDQSVLVRADPAQLSGWSAASS